MEIDKVIAELKHIRREYGNIEVCLQGPLIGHSNGDTPSYGSFFIVPEEHIRKDGGQIVNIRTWPY